VRAPAARRPVAPAAAIAAVAGPGGGAIAAVAGPGGGAWLARAAADRERRELVQLLAAASASNSPSGPAAGAIAERSIRPRDRRRDGGPGRR
jgi:hypothetical protein